MTFDEYVAEMGWTPMGDGNFWASDGESFIGALEARQAYGAREPTGYNFTGSDGRTYMVTADRGWNDPAAPGRYGLTAADTALAPDNSNPAWMAGDRGVLYDKAPQYSRSSIFDLGPFLVAALAAPAIAGSLAAAPAAGALSDAAIADIVAAEGGFSALPSAGMAGTAPVVTGALPESYWSMTAEAPGSTMTDVIPQAFAAPAPLPPIDPATIPLTAAEQQAAWAKAGLSPIGKSPFITGNALGDAVAKGALAGAGTSAIGGGDVGKGALMGAVTGGATNVISPAVSGLTAYPAVNQAIGNAALSAGTAGLAGGDPVTAVGNSAVRSGANAAGGALWNVASGALDGSLLTPTPEPVNNDLEDRRQVEAAEQAQQEQERQYAESQRIAQERQAEIEAEAQRQFQIQQQLEAELVRQTQQQNSVANAAPETALPNSEDTNMADDNWWGDLTALFADQEGYDSMNAIPSGNFFGNAGYMPIIGGPPSAEDIAATTMISGGPKRVDGSALDMAGLDDTYDPFADLSQYQPSGAAQLPAINDAYANQSIGPLTQLTGNPSSSAQDTLGLQQMGYDAGLRGEDLSKFVASGGTMGSTAAGGGGVGTGAGIPFGASGGAGGSATGGGGGSASNTININNGGALGNLPSWALPALVAGLALDNPDRTSTTKVEYPDWYNTGAKSALAQADKFGALGPDSIAPLSGNENEAIQMAKDSTGQWIPQLDKAASTLDESKYFYNKAGALNDAVPGFVNAASGRADAAMPYFGAAGALAGSVPGYLERAGGQVDASMPYFDKAGQTADTVGGYLNRATGQVDASMPYFGKAGGQVDASMPYFGKAGDMADSVSGYLNKSGALADQAAGGIPSVNLSAYMNPYLDNVLAPIARRNELAKAAALNDIRAKAGMRGAFGGSRSTLLESETAGTADRNMNEAEAGIRANAFNTGLNTAQADLNRILQASGQYGALGGIAGNTAGIYGGIGKTVADTGNIYSGVGKNIADTAGTFTTAGNVAGNTANVYGNIGKGIADTAGVFNNSGVVATGAANSLTGAGKGVADTADIFNKSAGALTGAANADTNIGRSLTDASSGYRANAGAFGTLTDADIARLIGTGATERSVDQARRNAPLTAIGGYAAALRGAGTPGATTTNVAPEASKIGQAATGLGALIGANKAGLI